MYPNYEQQRQRQLQQNYGSNNHSHPSKQTYLGPNYGSASNGGGGGLSTQLPRLDAVIIRNLTFEVGRGRGRRAILNKINLTVPQGSIYGLLGPSGCGKTTMLRCVVGRLRPRQGSLLVFGLRPGEPPSEVPGRDIGYMPQELSVYEDFTIEETLRYFGKINRMRGSDIEERIEFLIRFLDLPTRRRLVVNLSGGQKRRVSLAGALVHSPPLLILDEPTVGVDPLLRQSIWRHLVTLTQTERISVIITTHYIEEARQANFVGLMRHGRILAEDSPERLMRLHELATLEEVFLKLCVSDSSRRAAVLAAVDSSAAGLANQTGPSTGQPSSAHLERRRAAKGRQPHSLAKRDRASRELEAELYLRPTARSSSDTSAESPPFQSHVRINTATNKVERFGGPPLEPIPAAGGHLNEAVEEFSSESEAGESSTANAEPSDTSNDKLYALTTGEPSGPLAVYSEQYIAIQAMRWAARRSNELSMRNFAKYSSSSSGRRPSEPTNGTGTGTGTGSLGQWWRTLMAVTWKNYIRLRRNPPVLIFQFMLPAIQVILFCLCIGGEPFDVPVAVVNDEAVPRSSQQFLNGLNRNIIRQVRYDNLSSAIEAVRRGHVWGAIHIPDRYSQNLQSRLIMGEEVTKDTIQNGTIRVYPDLTNLHLALALETSFRDTFLEFARDSLEELGYDRSLADLPIQVGKPVYGTMKKDGYLEFMAPGVVISISYVMATGLTALAFILERRDGLLERSLVSGVQTSQILLAHAINQVVVMVIQIFLVLGCTFFIFEIPSRGPFVWVVLLILLQGCTGMGFGLLVSAICREENTAVMMLVGTFYTNLILAGIIWPIEAMPHWLRPLSYAQPQTLPTDTLRHILSRGWDISEGGVLLGFGVTIGWLATFLITAGLIFKYSG